MGVTLKEKRERFLKSLKVDQDIKEMLETIGKEYERQGRVFEEEEQIKLIKYCEWLETKDSNEELQLSKFNNWLKKEMDEER